jgi:curved DNA-binding protein
MAVEFKDYYKILGVGRGAGADEIRTAFRKLARQYHPDVAKNKAQAEEKFKEINEAYEVLSDPEKRQKYDTLGPDWQGRPGFRPPPGSRANRRPRPGAPGAGEEFEFEFGGSGFSDFFEQLFGSMRGAPGQTRGGAGSAFQDSRGRGQDTEAEIWVTLEEALSGSVRPVRLARALACSRCDGDGVTAGRVCRTCGGTGQTRDERVYQVKIPPGVRAGQLLRLPGHGQPAASGRSGDLFLRVRYATHPDFRVEDGELYTDVDLAPWEAVLGAKVSVRELGGRVEMRVPPGTQSGQRFRLRGRGLPRGEGERGDLFVVVRIAVPEHVTDTERDLWEQLARDSAFRPRE